MLIRIDEETAAKVESVRKAMGHRSATATVKALIEAEELRVWEDQHAGVPRTVAPKGKRSKVAT